MLVDFANHPAVEDQVHTVTRDDLVGLVRSQPER
jgi:hypothetical protein